MKMEIGSLRGQCTCGREHELAVKDIIIEKDALKKLSGMLESGILSQYTHPVIICDEHTLTAAEGQMEDVIAKLPVIELNPDNLHANNHGVAVAEAALARLEGAEDAAEDDGTAKIREPESALSGEIDLLFALGSGTIHDLTRYIAHKRGIDFVSLPTAASVDGFVSTVAAMTWDGMKATLPAVAPIYVIADTSVISRAPYRLTASGMADLFGKFTAIADWQIAHAVTGEYYCGRIADMEMDAINDVKDCMDDLRNGLPETSYRGLEMTREEILEAARSDILPETEEAHAKLMYALLLSGLAMQMVGNSRPASCAEHHMSHFWEMEVLNDHIDALHGEKVGVGLLLVTRRYKEIAEKLRAGKYHIEPWKGIEMDKIEASYGKKGLMEGTMKENTPDPMAGITPEQLEKNVPEIIRIIDTVLPSGEEIEELLKRGGCPSSMEEIHLPESLAEDSLTLSPYVRNRLSFNRLRKMIVTE